MWLCSRSSTSGETESRPRWNLLHTRIQQICGLISCNIPRCHRLLAWNAINFVPWWILDKEIHNNRLMNKHHLWNGRNINSWFSPKTSAYVRNNCTMYNDVKHVRLSLLKLKGHYYYYKNKKAHTITICTIYALCSRGQLSRSNYSF